MQSSEGFLLRKFQYREADYILSIFTRDIGKIRGIARNAKRSTKRFGGRLEPFIKFIVDFSTNSRGMHSIEDVTMIKPYSKIVDDFELFLWGNVIIELTDVITPIEESNVSMFGLLDNTLSRLEKGVNTLPVILKFILKALSLSGYKPNITNCVKCGNQVKNSTVFNIKGGGVLCSRCSGSIGGAKISLEVLNDEEFMQIHLSKVLEHIKIFIRFAEYHTEKELKSAKFIEDIKI